MTPYAHILSGPWHKWQNGDSRWVVWLIVVVWAVCFVGAAWFLGARAAEEVARFGTILVLLGLWLVVFDNLIAQNTPVAARLVPGHLPALRTAAVATWFCTTTLLALTLPKGLAWIWGSGLLLLITACIFRWPLGVAALLIAGPFALNWAAHSVSWRQFSVHVFTLPQSADIGCLAIGGLLAAALLCRLFQNGSSRHVRHHSQRKSWRDAWRFGDAGIAAESSAPWGRRSRNWLDAPYYTWLRYVVKTARPTERSVLARLEMAIAPGSHWTAVFKSLAINVGLFAALFLLMKVVAGTNMATLLSQFGMPFAIGIFGTTLSVITQLPSHYYRSRNEQSVLALLPGVPSGTRFNHALARRKLMSFAVIWVLVSGLAWAAITYGAPNDARNQPLLGFSIGCLPASFWVLRDWSRLSQSNLWTVMLPTAVMPALGFAFFSAIGLLHWLPWLLLIAMLALCSAVIAWRWRRMGQYPHALPMGRMPHNAK